MSVSITVSLVFAILSPIVFGIMNVLDKYIVSKKVKNPMSFSVVAASVVFFAGLIISIFLDWSNISLKEVIYPAIAGILAGSQYFFYYIVMQKEDVSHFVGLFYTYPLFVAIFSFIFLRETLSFAGYLGVFFILMGITFLSIRIKQIKLKANVWMIIFMILLIAVYELLIKVTTNNLPVMNGIVINFIFIGITVYFMLFNKKIRTGIKYELKNVPWALITESFTFFGILTVYFAMVNIKATFVSAIGAIQPLVVLFFERIVNSFIGKISRDNLLLPKLIPILLIVLGLVLMYLQEILALI
jgi:uncharacterized membrane protein